MLCINRLLVAGVAALGLQGAAFAAPHATALQARAMLDHAVAEVKSAGDKAALLSSTRRRARSTPANFMCSSSI